MGISIPSFHLKASRDLPHLRRMLKGEGKHRNIHEDLTLTSMIDMFSVIIIFLIQSFSASGEIFMANKDIHLPQASYARELRRAPIVTILPDKITLEGATVGDNTNINNIIEEKDWDLPLLTRQLEDYREFFKKTNPQATFPNEIIIQTDRKTNFVFVKRALYSLVKIGYTNISLAVRGEVVPQSAPTPAAAEEGKGG